MKELVAGTTTDYLVIQGDGNVIIDGEGQASIIYDGNYWEFHDLIFVNCTALWTGNTNYFPGRFIRCKFKNVIGFVAASVGASFKLTKHVFMQCVFDGMTNANSSLYLRYFTFFNCTFISGNPCCDGGADASGYGNSWHNCIFYAVSGSQPIQSNRYLYNYGVTLN